MNYEVTIPVLNEEKTLEKNILKILDFFETNQLNNWKVIIADNGSTDKTSEIGKALAKKHNIVRYIKVGKKGVGLALRTSWLQSSADVVGYMDLDLATDLKHLKDVINKFNSESTIVNASRLIKGSIVNNRTLLRDTTSRAFNLLAKVLIGYNVSDGMCGFKFFKRDKVTKIINTGVDTDGWFFSTEILAKANWLGYIIDEIPVVWTDDRKSKVKVIPLSINYFKELIRLKGEKKSFIKKEQK